MMCGYVPLLAPCEVVPTFLICGLPDAYTDSCTFLFIGTSFIWPLFSGPFQASAGEDGNVSI